MQQSQILVAPGLLSASTHDAQGVKAPSSAQHTTMPPPGIVHDVQQQQERKNEQQRRRRRLQSSRRCVSVCVCECVRVCVYGGGGEVCICVSGWAGGGPPLSSLRGKNKNPKNGAGKPKSRRAICPRSADDSLRLRLHVLDG